MRRIVIGTSVHLGDDTNLMLCWIEIRFISCIKCMQIVRRFFGDDDEM